MTREDAIAYVEGQFNCEYGAPTRFADLGYSKPYQEILLDRPMSTSEFDTNRLLVARFIEHIRSLKNQAGFDFQAKPKLFWRWQDKVRLWTEDGRGHIHSRFYIDGNPGMQGNPGSPRGRPTVGQLRIAA